MAQTKSYLLLEAELKDRRSGWWPRIVAAIPELAALSGTPQPENYHAEGDAAVHTRLTVEACPPDADPDLLWAALLHDVGKPLVTRHDGNQVVARGHPAVGAEIAQNILKRLAMPAERCAKIVWAVRNHLFHLSWNLKAPAQASRRHKRFIADSRFALLLELLKADSAASAGNSRGLAAYELYKRLKEWVDAAYQ